MAKPLMSEPSFVEVGIAVGKLKRYKSLGTDHILAELIKAEGETLCSEICKLIYSIWNKELPQQWKDSIIIPIHKKADKIDWNNYRGVSLFYQLPTKFYPTFFWPDQLHISVKLLGIIIVGSVIIDLLPIRFSTFARY
jgi:hypothetical protein